MKNKILFSLILSTILFQSCKNENQVIAVSEKPVEVVPDVDLGDQQLNITILLDLSDRVEPTKYPAKPEHFERDIELVSYFTEFFKKEMSEKGAYKAEGKIKVIFSPRPADNEINSIASNLNIDLSKARDNKHKKEIFDNITSDFRSNLETIYSKTIETKQYPGSDIWRFFKNDVSDYALTSDPDYRNILVILTDGYLYHEDSKDKSSNRSAYLLPNTVQQNGLRNSNWQNKFQEGDFGFITTREDLENLEVLVLEISPSPSYKNDEDVIKAYLEKWFQEMNVKEYAVYNSDLPEYTKTRISNFLTKS
ncbi:MAG TPA: hypothetical protein VK921_09875 [Anditalea sp.]|nr:hypothetical protein [Anditalea sp.]